MSRASLTASVELQKERKKGLRLQFSDPMEHFIDKEWPQDYTKVGL